ncbi:hypothetical protein ASF92_09715 [Pedobacter sp. Leaf176]|nr:hypothetical protein ASF92_09715 [Pedobacter sp. Leaf176]
MCPIIGHRFPIIKFFSMATNGKSGDNRRHGTVSDRSQTFNPTTEQWAKRDIETGRFMDVKQAFKGIRREKK